MDSRRYRLLYNINSPKDIKKLNVKQMELLSSEIRCFLLDKVSKTGGHIASNLGIVELTIALHYVFNSPKDKIVWDVGHQSYVHKILTGRREKFDTLRQLDGLSGFPKTCESEHDAFNTGHSSTSISTALGMAKARDIKNENNSVIAVIGDGALTGGISFEGLNHAGRSNSNIIVILNDNEMSIDKNVGGLSSYLGKIRTRPLYYKVKGKAEKAVRSFPVIGSPVKRIIHKIKGSIKYIITQGMLFEELGFKYIGPVDGHNINEIIKVLKNAQKAKGPILIHVCTIKGKGYKYAEECPHTFHGVSSFDIESGKIFSKGKGTSFSNVFGKKILELAKKDEKIVAITAAMPHGTGLEKFMNQIPDRFFDVGIAEQHAVAFAAGLAANGLKPVFAVYSSFLQRGYDQLIHDIAIQDVKVVFAIDRAGIVGKDGETHQGLFDLSFLSTIPNLIVLAPADYTDFEQMIEFAFSKEIKNSVAIRYPRGEGHVSLFSTTKVEYKKAVQIQEGNDISIISSGTMLENAINLGKMLDRKGIKSDIIHSRFIKPLDDETIIASAKKTKRVITLEDNIKSGGFGSSIITLLSDNDIDAKIKCYSFPNKCIEHGTQKQLFERYGLDAKSIFESIMEFFIDI